MKREYADGVKEKVTYFTGREVEKTAAYATDTLFVVGCQPFDDVWQKAQDLCVDHVYLGANQSFEVQLPHGDNATNQAWDSLVLGLLEKGLYVTLDYDAKFHEYVLENSWVEFDNFIPMISVKLPYIQQLPYNACIKLDDVDFRASNPGVWVHHVHDLKQRSKFTSWDKYTKDEELK